MTRFVSQVSEIKKYNYKYSHFYLELIQPNQIQFKAGQFIMVNVDNQETKRAYSICSESAKTHGIELLINLQDQGTPGPGTKYFQNLKIGEKIIFSGPLGEFYLKPPADQENVFIATGCGIAPIRSLIFESVKKNIKTTLFWGLKNEKEIFWTEEWDQLSEEIPGFSWELILSQPSEKWPLAKGRINGLIKKYLKKNKIENKSFYLCGNKKMIDQLSAELQVLSINSNKIHSEKF
jgi:ferredoxin-NADP reductase